MIWFNTLLTNMNTNIFSLPNNGEYPQKYDWVEKKRANTNMNIFGLTKKGKYKYKYK